MRRFSFCRFPPLLKRAVHGAPCTAPNQGQKMHKGEAPVLWHRCRCGAIIPQGVGVCPACAAGKNSGQSRHMEYNRFRRDKKAAEFYVSQEWRTTRAAVLKLYDGLDLYAWYVQKRVAPADMVHHIVELEDDWTRRCDMGNLFPLSTANHGIITALYKRDQATKTATQDVLRGIIAEHWKDTGGIEKVLCGLN